MNRSTVVTTILAIAFVYSACKSDPTIEAESFESLERSRNHVRAQLTVDRQDDFDDSFALITNKAALNVGWSGRHKILYEYRMLLDDLTGEEIIQLGKDLREKEKQRQKKLAFARALRDEARERQKQERDLVRLQDLEEKEQTIVARAHALRNCRVVSAELFNTRKTPYFLLKIVNLTGKALTEVRFNAKIPKLETKNPDARQTLYHTFTEPLAPGDTKEIKVSFTWSFTIPALLSDSDVEIEITRLKGIGNVVVGEKRPFDENPFQQMELQSLRAQYPTASFTKKKDTSPQ